MQNSLQRIARWQFDFNVSCFSRGSTTEAVDRFCYLGNMLSVDVSADVAATARIQCCWTKFTVTYFKSQAFLP